MTILNKIFAAAKAVKAGESLKDPAAWKNKQILMNALLIIIGVISKFIKIELSEAEINSISFGFVTLAGVVNTYLTAATSDKVGV